MLHGAIAMPENYSPTFQSVAHNAVGEGRFWNICAHNKGAIYLCECVVLVRISAGA